MKAFLTSVMESVLGHTQDLHVHVRVSVYHCHSCIIILVVYVVKYVCVEATWKKGGS